MGGGEGECKGKPWRKPRCSIYIFTQPLNSYSPTRYKHFLVSSGFYLAKSANMNNNIFFKNVIKTQFDADFKFKNAKQTWWIKVYKKKSDRNRIFCS
jgi:hypothetical protein